MRALEAVTLIDELFRRAVEEPAAVDDQLLADWMDQAAEAIGPDREGARALRGAVRKARKLARYWSQRDPDSLPDWRNGVDEALGARGWDGQLDLLMDALDQSPDPELFAEAKARHRAVHFAEWMEGVSFEEWLAGRGEPRTG